MSKRRMEALEEIIALGRNSILFEAQMDTDTIRESVQYGYLAGIIGSYSLSKENMRLYTFDNKYYADFCVLGATEGPFLEYMVKIGVA